MTLTQGEVSKARYHMLASKSILGIELNEYMHILKQKLNFNSNKTS